MATKKGVRRLNKLADFLQAGVPGKFAMEYWAFRMADNSRLDCGSIACALGWATTIPSFRRAGLTLICGFPAFNGFYGIDAAQVFFDIEYHDAMKVFMPPDMGRLRGYAARRVVVGRIRALARELEKELADAA